MTAVSVIQVSWSMPTATVEPTWNVDVSITGTRSDPAGTCPWIAKAHPGIDERPRRLFVRRARDYSIGALGIKLNEVDVYVGFAQFGGLAGLLQLIDE